MAPNIHAWTRRFTRHSTPGRLTDAEAACHELRRRFPDQIDWLQRFADLYETRRLDALAAMRH